MEICCGGGANVLGPIDAVRARGTRSAEDADDDCWSCGWCNMGLLCILWRMVNCYVLSYVLRWEVLSTG